MWEELFKQTLGKAMEDPRASFKQSEAMSPSQTEPL